jgi:hypothetical protein
MIPPSVNQFLILRHSMDKCNFPHDPIIERPGSIQNRFSVAIGKEILLNSIVGFGKPRKIGG